MATAIFLRADPKPKSITITLISLAVLLCSYGLTYSYGYGGGYIDRSRVERYDHQRAHRLLLLEGDGVDVKIDVTGDGCSSNATVCLDQSVYRRRSTCCADVCVNTRSDVLNCGACGATCAAGLVCCKGSCVNLLSDNRHCGKCKHRCPDADCELGLCGYGS